MKQKYISGYSQTVQKPLLDNKLTNARLTPHDTRTRLGLIKNRYPRIIVEPIAWEKMNNYVGFCNYEVGWLGTVVEAAEDIYIIDDVFLFEQEVSAVTTSIDDESMSEFANTLLAEPDGLDKINRLRFWGHSHVNMQVEPSGQDNDQMESFADSGYDYMIRGIANKHGDMKFDVYDYRRGLIFSDIPWMINIPTSAELSSTILSEMESKVRLARVRGFTGKTYKTTGPLYDDDDDDVPSYEDYFDENGEYIGGYND
ncbi:MAG: hypothetical protein WC284_17450 [Candidimonas sp.]